MKQYKWPFILCGCFLVIGIIGSIILWQKSNSNIVEIVQDEKVLYQLDLSQDDRILEIEYEGRVNIIEIKDHRIHVLKAQCPDNTCVSMGWLETVPIVCLPNQLVIQFKNN